MCDVAVFLISQHGNLLKNFRSSCLRLDALLLIDCSCGWSVCLSKISAHWGGIPLSKVKPRRND